MTNGSGNKIIRGAFRYAKIAVELGETQTRWKFNAPLQSCGAGGGRQARIRAHTLPTTTTGKRPVST